MIVQGKMIREGLAVGSSEVKDLVDEIKLKKLTGYLYIEFRNYTFVQLIEKGDLTNGFRVIEDQLYSFSHLADAIYSLEGATVSFFGTSPGALQGMLDMKFGDQIYGTLYTSFTDLGKLFQTLNQEKHTGSVEINLPDDSCVVLMEEGVPTEVVCSEEKKEKEGEREREREDEKLEKMLQSVFDKASSENGVVRVFERRIPPAFLYPDPEEIFIWSNPRRLKLEFAFGQLGKEFEDLLDQKMTISQILNTLYVDFTEIADMYTYLSAKGYITTGKGLA